MRDVDVSGVSGIGHVADGVMFGELPGDTNLLVGADRTGCRRSAAIQPDRGRWLDV